MIWIHIPCKLCSGTWVATHMIFVTIENVKKNILRQKLTKQAFLWFWMLTSKYLSLLCIAIGNYNYTYFMWHILAVNCFYIPCDSFVLVACSWGSATFTFSLKVKYFLYHSSYSSTIFICWTLFYVTLNANKLAAVSSQQIF